MGNQAMALRPEVIDDLAEATHFTPQEIREYYKRFLSETPHGHMTLTEEEFKKVYKAVFPDGNADKFATQVFAVCDKDGDGKIDFREFLTSVAVQQKGTFEDKLNWAFDLYDLDNSGKISKSELTEMIKSFRQLKTTPIAPSMMAVKPEDLAAYIIEKADTDKDWELSRTEFLAAANNSKTVKAMVLGSLDATASPILRRKNTK